MLSRILFEQEEDAYVRPLTLGIGRSYWLFQDEMDSLELQLFPDSNAELRGDEEESIWTVGWNMVGPLVEDAVVESSARVWCFQDGGWYPLEAADGEYHLQAGEGYMIWKDSSETQ